MTSHRKPLTKEDKNLLKTYRIDDELIEQAGLYRVDTRGAALDGFRHTGDLSGVVFPYFDSHGKPFNARLRRDNPEIGANGKVENKYISLPGKQRGLYWLPVSRELARREEYEFVPVEAEKSAMAGMAWAKRSGSRLIFVATGGCRGWMNGEGGGLPDLDQFDRRKVRILLDANVATSPAVQQAETELAAYLTNLGAIVTCYRLPQLEGVNGPDDFLAAKKDADLVALFKKPVEPWLSRVGESYDAYMNATPPTFLIKDFLQTGGATFIGGLPGDGKTFVLLSMVQSLLTGKKLFGYFTIPDKVKRCVYLSPEITLGSFQARATKFGIDPFVKDQSLIVRTLNAHPQIALDDPAVMLTARDAVVFLDPAVRFMAGDENSNSDNDQGLARVLFQLLHAGARAIVAAHHSPKEFEKTPFMTLNNCLRGASAIGGMLTSAWGIYQLDRLTRTQTVCYMANLKPRDFEPPPGFQIIGKPHIDEGRGFQMHVSPEHCGSLEESKKEFGNKPGRPPSDDRQRRFEIIRSNPGKSIDVIEMALASAGVKAIARASLKTQISQARKQKP